MVNRIKYYGDNDLVNYLFWEERLPQISRLFADNALTEKSNDTFDLNDILELYNVGIGYSHFNDVAKGKYDILFYLRHFIKRRGCLALLILAA